MKLLLLVFLQLILSARSLSSEDQPHRESEVSPRYLINENWHELGEGIGGEHFNDLAGHCVASNKDGTIIAVSSPRYIKPGYAHEPFGRVRVYKFEPETDRWIKIGKDILGEELDEFGYSLAMDQEGKNIVVGMINDNERGKDAGTVRVYVYDNNSGEERWIQKGPQLVGETSFEEFGAAVDISKDGKVIAVGSPKKDVGQEAEAGSVRVYEYEPNAKKWALVGESMLGTTKFDHFGAALSLSEDGYALAVGAPHSMDYNTGSVRAFLYDFESATWLPMGTIAGENLGDMFGSSVSLYERDGFMRLIAGSPHHDGGNGVLRESGQARVYKFHNGGTWELEGKPINGLRSGDRAGSSVAIAKHNMGIVAVGSPNSSQNGKNSGHANVWYYDADEDDWKQQGLDVDGEKPLDFLGSDMSLSYDGQKLIVGAPGGEYAKIFALSATSSPTMSPTKPPIEGSDGKKKGTRNGFVRFLSVVAIVGLICLGVFGLYKGVMNVIRNRRGRTHVPSPTELEMQQVHRVGDDEGDENGDENNLI